MTRNRIREKLETLLSFFLSFITITKTGAGLFDRIHQKSEHTELPIIGWPLPNNSSVSAGRREMRSGRGGRRRERREREKMLKRGQKGRKKKMREGVTAMTSQKTRWKRKRGIYADFQHLIKVIFFLRGPVLISPSGYQTSDKSTLISSKWLYDWNHDEIHD